MSFQKSIITGLIICFTMASSMSFADVISKTEARKAITMAVKELNKTLAQYNEWKSTVLDPNRKFFNSTSIELKALIDQAYYRGHISEAEYLRLVPTAKTPVSVNWMDSKPRQAPASEEEYQALIARFVPAKDSVATAARLTDKTAPDVGQIIGGSSAPSSAGRTGGKK